MQAVLLVDSPPRLVSRRAFVLWRGVQAAFWGLGLAIFGALIFWPAVGIHAFWNVLIPVAPALLAIAPGFWRNVCPLGTTALLPRHLGLSRKGRLSTTAQGRLLLIGVVLLVAIVPLRHVALDLSGPLTALAIGVLAVAAVIAGALFEWKSGWCSGLCPVHPVERLYGVEPLLSVPNLHCHPCQRCVGPCPESTPGFHALAANRTPARRLAGTLMAGGFAGFVWGWFQVPDYLPAVGLAHLPEAYFWPLAGMAVTLLGFVGLLRLLPGERQLVVRVFAAAAIACYYWYRVPALFGFGPFPGDGTLTDLSGTLPAWFPAISRTMTTGFFVWWLVGRRAGRRAWAIRPALAS